MIPMHATATANPQRLRWVVAPGHLPPVGIVRRAPGRLGALLNRGVIDELAVGAGDVVITLSAGNNWQQFGDRVRDALADALLDPAGWRIDGVSPEGSRLAEIATELLDGPIGALAQSHGGSIELVSVTGTDVTVRISGACNGCPAVDSTLHDRLERELHRRTGKPITVSTETKSAPRALGRKLLSLIVR